MNPPVDQARDTRKGEELNEANLLAFLQEKFPETEAPLHIRQFPSGFSNLTYHLAWGTHDWVLRRPPFGANIKSAHDMGREYRLLEALHGTAVRVPEPIAYCEDEGVLGAPFYLMRRVQGVILRGAMPAAQLPPAGTMAGIAQSWIETLAAIHQTELTHSWLQQLGKPEGYVARQVTGWIGRYQKAKTDDVADMERVAKWLTENQPTEVAACLIHNDYKYDNVVLNPENLTEIVAVLDWEMATLGDPFMDLGTSLGYWLEPNDPEALQQLKLSPTTAPGNPSREEVVASYERATGRQVNNPVFYYAFGLFKIAVIIQQIYYRYQKGYTQDPRFKGLIHGVKGCSLLAAKAIARNRLGDLFTEV